MRALLGLGEPLPPIVDDLEEFNNVDAEGGGDEADKPEDDDDDVEDDEDHVAAELREAEEEKKAAAYAAARPRGQAGVEKLGGRSSRPMSAEDDAKLGGAKATGGSGTVV